MKEIAYRRLSNSEREEISRGLATGQVPTQIAKQLGRNPSTIFREINRNSGTSGYRAFSAGQKAKVMATIRRGGKRRLIQEENLCTYVLAGLRKHWSPREIVRRMEIQYPRDERMRISHEAVYQYIYVLPRGSLKKELVSALRQERKYRRKQGGRKGKPEENRGKIAEMLSIEERPKEVENRIIPGHWEGDLIMGKYKQSAIGTLVGESVEDERRVVTRGHAGVHFHEDLEFADSANVGVRHRDLVGAFAAVAMACRACRPTNSAIG